MSPYPIQVGNRSVWVTSDISPIVEEGRTIAVTGLLMLAAIGLKVPAAPALKVVSESVSSKLLLLTAREREVYHWLREGKSNDEIGLILQVSSHTIKNHLDHIYQKLGVNRRMDAALLSVG